MGDLAVKLAGFRGALARTENRGPGEAASDRQLLHEQIEILDRLFQALGQAALSAPEAGPKYELMRLAFRAQAQTVTTFRALHSEPSKPRGGCVSEMIMKMADEELAALAGIECGGEYALDD